MTIASFQAEAVGARIYAPEGPFGAGGGTPLPNFKPGVVAAGDCEGELVFLNLQILSAPVTLNQGDVIAWDNSYTAVLLATATATRGMSVGTFFCGGRFGDPAALQGGGWSATFPAAGTYGIWAQRAGTSLVNAASTAANANLVNSTTTAGRVDAPATAPVGSRQVSSLYIAPLSGTFTANTVIGSNLLSNVSSLQGVVRGQQVTGTGIPVGTTVLDITGNSVVMSNSATAANTGITVTWANNAFVANTTAGSTTLTGVSGVAGVYPNQTIAGAGIPGGTTIVSINGNLGNYTITLSAAATATATAAAMTTSGYLEGYLKWPLVDKAN